MQYSHPIFEELAFQGPSECFTPVFNRVMCTALDIIERVARGHCFITGSSVLMEALRTMDNQIRFTPGDVDVFVNTNFLRACGVESPAAFVNLIKRAGQEFDVGFADGTKKETTTLSYEYSFKIGKDETILSIINVLVVDTKEEVDVVHPIAIQLIFVCSEKKLLIDTDFISAILSHFDVNICRVVYDLHKKKIVFPTDSMIFWYVLENTFYYEPNGSCDAMLRRVMKYRNRGFKHLGYWNNKNGIGHKLYGDMIVQGETNNPHSLFMNFEEAKNNIVEDYNK